jgi:hypothetical protein
VPDAYTNVTRKMMRLRPLVYRGTARCLVLVTLLIVAVMRNAHAQESDRAPCEPDTTRAQLVDIAGPWATAARMKQLQGEAPVTALTMRRPSVERSIGSCAYTAERWSTTAAPLPIRVRSTYNSNYPVDVNNGAMWAGRGVGSALSAGGEVRIGPLSAAIYPVVVYQQNREFELKPVGRADRSTYAYAANPAIDWPQRHGATDYFTLDWGQSYIRLEAFGATVGLSSENFWLGPAQRMSLLMGSSAAGFPHLFVGTARPIDIFIGNLEALAFWGQLRESDYFDHDPANDRTLMAGVSTVFEPAFARGLFVGASRMFLADWRTGGFWRAFEYTSVRADPAGDNHLISIYARWVLPVDGFEAYAEWARDDHWGDWQDLLREPDHTQAYMLGLQKTGRWRGAVLRWFGELAHLGVSTTLRGGRGVPSFYTHSEIQRGYTHRGQLLGAWIGPGSDAQILGFEHIAGRRTTGLLLERVRFDADAYYLQWAPFYGSNGHDVAIGATLRRSERIGSNVHVHAALGLARRHNRNFVLLDGSHPGEFRAETNVQLDLDLRWTPQLRPLRHQP